MVYGDIKLIYILISSLPDKHYTLRIVLFDFLGNDVWERGEYQLMSELAAITKEIVLLQSGGREVQYQL